MPQLPDLQASALSRGPRPASGDLRTTILETGMQRDKTALANDASRTDQPQHHIRRGVAQCVTAEPGYGQDGFD